VPVLDEAGRAACAGRRREDNVRGELRSRQRHLEAGRMQRLPSPRLAGRTTHTVKTHADKVDLGNWVRRHPFSSDQILCTTPRRSSVSQWTVKRATPVPSGQPGYSEISLMT
jgi:hypothetical protein